MKEFIKYEKDFISFFYLYRKHRLPKRGENFADELQSNRQSRKSAIKLSGTRISLIKKGRM